MLSRLSGAALSLSLANACTASPAPEHRVGEPAPAALDPQPDPSDPPAPEALSEPKTPAETAHCVADSSRGEPWAALHTLLQRSSIPAGFACPAQFQLVQRRPWTLDSPFSQRGRAGEIFEFTGRDAATGDVILATLGIVDQVTESDARWASRDELDAHAFFNIVPEQPAEPRALAGPGLAVHRWYSLRFAARPAVDAARAVTWFAAHPDTKALDVVALAFDVFEDGDDGAITIVHHHAGSTLTICALGDEARRCWARADVRRSVLGSATYSVELDVEPDSGPAQTWTIDEDMTLELAGDTPSSGPAWDQSDALPGSLAPLIAGGRHIRARRPDLVTIGHYQSIGHATIVHEPIVEYILTRRGDQWTTTATPALILDDVITLGDSLGVVEARRVVSAGGLSDSLRLLVFDGADYLGQVPALVGEVEASPLGEYAWRHTVRLRGSDCVQLGPGTSSGVTQDPETDAERPIEGPMRKFFETTRGPWRISTDGLRPGCAR